MNEKLYTTIKLSLLKFDFDVPHSFGDLFEHSKQFRHGQPFKKFVKICKNMGVYSRVVRTGEGLARVLVYDATQDKYINNDINILKTCEHCNGSGIVQAPLEITDKN